MKLSTLKDVLSKEVYCNSNVSLTGSGGKAPSRWAIFRNFFEQKSCFNTIRSHFARIQNHLKELEFLTFESQLKKLSYSVLLLLAI